MTSPQMLPGASVVVVVVEDVVEVVEEVVDDVVVDEVDDVVEDDVVELVVEVLLVVVVVVDVVVVPHPGIGVCEHCGSLSTHASVVQATPSSQFVGAPAAHSPVPLQADACVHGSLSLQALPGASAAEQFFSPSLHDSAQLASLSGPGHGLPAWSGSA